MKRTFKNKATRGFAILLMCTLFFSTSFFSDTKKVEAQVFVPTLDAPNLAQNTITAVNTMGLLQKEIVADGILFMAMKIVISNITDSIVAWINSGFEGNPAFVADPESFFINVADQVAGNYIAGTDLGFLCEPFRLDIRFALNLNYTTNFQRKIGCTLTDVLQNTENFVNFTRGDFARGGWSGWLSVSQNRQNNVYGAYLVAKNEMTRRILEKVTGEQKKLDWGNGFLSWSECLNTDSDGNCLARGPIQTPGSVIEGQLENVLGSGIRQLELADEINEIVGALVGQLVNQVLVEGLSSVGSVSQGSGSGESGGALSQQIFAQCQPSQFTADIGENITWSVNLLGGGPATYQWLGSAPLAGLTGQTANVTYTTVGTKTGRVRVTTSTQSATFNCIGAVEVN